MNKTVAKIALLVIALGLTACSSGGGFAPLATATLAPTPSPTLTITPTNPPDPLLVALANGALDSQQAEVEKKKAEAAEIYAKIEREKEDQKHNHRMTEQSFEKTVEAAAAHDTSTAMPTMTPIPSATPLPFEWTATVAISNAEVEKIEGDAELTTLAVGRQQMKNWMDAYLPWTLIVAAVVIGSILAYIGAQVRTLKRDRNGMLSVHVEKKGNQTVVIRPDLMKTPYATITSNGDVVERGTPDEFQQQTTRRQQLIETGRGRSMGEFQQAIRLLGGATQAAGGNINYFDADKFLGGILKDAEEDLIEGEVTDVK